MKSHIQDVDEFLRIARDRYTFGLAVDASDREEAEADNLFAAALPVRDGGTTQWHESAAKARIAASRPCITWNRIPVYVAQVVNEGRQNKPAIKIAPMDGGTKETADFFQARIRHIEYETDADTARDTAREQQVTTGRGFVRVSTEFKPGAMDQSLTIDAIPNQFSVVWDPAKTKYDCSDAEWNFVVSRISKEKHMRDYGKDSVVNRLDFTNMESNPAPEWIGVGEGGELIQVAEYWVKEFQDRILCKLQMPDGSFTKAYLDELPAEHPPIVAQLKEKCATVWQYVINGAEILEETKWIDYDIPIVPYWGRQSTVNGKSRTFSLIRNAKEPQRGVNLYVSNIFEQIAQMPKTPYMVPLGGIPANLEDDYENLNNSPKAYVYYNARDEDGNPLPAPSRVVTEPPIQALTIGLNQAIDAIKAAMGIFDAALGAKSNETSGLAIERRKQQTGIVNFHFTDNEARSNKYLGSILCRCIKKLDRTGMNVPVRDEMGKTSLVPIGVPHPDPKTGQAVTIDPSTGDYGVSVSSGKSYSSQREEAFERDTALVTADPELLWVIGDQMFAEDDSAGSQERSERMARAIELKSPGLIQKPGQQQQIPPQVQQQMQAMQQKLQQTEAFAQSLHEQIQSKQSELQSKLQLAQLNNANKLQLAQMDLDFKREQLATQTAAQEAALASKEAITLLGARVDGIDAERGRSHDAALQLAAQDHQAGLQASTQQHQVDQQSSAQDAAVEQAEQAQQQPGEEE